jgi:hypothetical protein
MKPTMSEEMGLNGTIDDSLGQLKLSFVGITDAWNLGRLMRDKMQDVLIK